MPVSIETMQRRMASYRDEIEDEVIGPAKDELQRIFREAEVELAKQAKAFNMLIVDRSTGKLSSAVENIEKATVLLDEVDAAIRRVIVDPGHVWADQAGELAHAAGRELARVNFNVSQVSPELVRAAFENVTITEGALRVGYEDMYRIINTVGSDVGTWFRRTTLDAVLEGLPVVNKMGGDSLMSRLVESGRLKPITIRTESGKLIRRSVSQRAEAIARIEMGRIVNRTHEELAREVLGDAAVYRNSNPRDSRTTDICMRASRQSAMTLQEWSDSEFGRPPRLRPFHLCRSVLIGGEAEWFQ
uniref:Uncharacterized protein n=1 Tax=viral metagenome TaxID=1070528 RepID=A0A6M3LN56_9ZZZZ